MLRVFEYFDRTYVINLVNRTDRLRGAVQQFHEIGIELPSDRYQIYAATVPAEQGDFYSLGARGSFTSHREILRLAIKANLKNVLVVEDDVRFGKIEGELANKIINSLTESEWDVVYFGYLEPRNVASAGSLVSWHGKTIGGHFYAVNGGFFDRMISYMDRCEMRPRDHPEGGPMSRDGAYNHIRLLDPTIRVLLAVPNLATQRSSRTDIGNLRFFDRIAPLRPFIEVLRSVKERLKHF